MSGMSGMSAGAQAGQAGQACAFCGRREPAHHKLLARSYVAELLARQRAAGVECPAGDLMRAELARAGLGQGADDAEMAEMEEVEALESLEPQLLSCMCCYYWVERRRALPVAPLPMQNLLWFVRTLCWCESVCDSRVLQRLVATVAEPDNVFARLFDESELAGLRRIARELSVQRATPPGAARVQGAERFCVKRAIARLWRGENADCLLLPHAAAADWLR
jgi:hypothetical protein